MQQIHEKMDLIDVDKIAIDAQRCSALSALKRKSPLCPRRASETVRVVCKI